MIGYLSSVLLTSPSIIFNLLGQMAEKMQPVASLIVFFISYRWWNQFPSASVRGLPRPVSDHCPLILDADLHKDVPRPFRFENMWLCHHSFKKNVYDWWNETSIEDWAGLRFEKKLLNLKSQLKAWNKNTFGDVSKRKEDLLQIIRDLDKLASIGLSEQLRLELNQARDEFQELVI